MAITKLSNGSWLLRAPTSAKEEREWLEVWQLQPEVQRKAWALGELSILEAGIRLWMLSGRRSPQEQARLRSTVSSRPVADRGESLHLSGEAFDVGTDHDLRRSDWERLTPLAECLGLRHGIEFTPPDPNHFDVGRPSR